MLDERVAELFESDQDADNKAAGYVESGCRSAFEQQSPSLLYESTSHAHTLTLVCGDGFDDGDDCSSHLRF